MKKAGKWQESGLNRIDGAGRSEMPGVHWELQAKLGCVGLCDLLARTSEGPMKNLYKFSDIVLT